MTFLLGTLAAGIVSGLVILTGYAIAGLFSTENGLTRLALASIIGLAWIVFFASAAGALLPLRGLVAWLAWTPAAATLFVSKTRERLISDFTAAFKSPSFVGAIAGGLALWLALLLPFLVHPDLAFFDGKTNHDNFFWCIGAEYLQHHDYLGVPGKNPDRPLFNLIWPFCGWQPAWARMATEGFMAIASALFGLTPIRLYNFLASSLMVPWTLVSAAVAQRLGLPRLNRLSCALFFFCQPILYFYIANGNIPNLLGALFSGGLWLATLLIADNRGNIWRLGIAGMLLFHGILASYPEILLFGLAPAGLLAIRHLASGECRRCETIAWLGGIVAAGLCLNPVTTVRVWSGIQISMAQVHNDSIWANIFDRISFAGYIPGLITLGVPTVRLYGIAGGLVASAVVMIAVFLLFKNSQHRWTLLFSFSGFVALVVYTVATSFGYGWQKSVQFSGIHFAVLFPALAAGAMQQYQRAIPIPRFSLFTFFALFGLLIHSMIGVTAENLKSSGTKGLTNTALAFHYQVEEEFPNRTIHVDGATFHAAFFQGMWSAKIFPNNPLVFLPRDEQPGGYFWDTIRTEDPTKSTKDRLFYVAHDWADAFDYDAPPLISDRTSVLLTKHNFVTAFSGFYRAVGVPQMAKEEFSLTIYPYADGWLEFIFVPTGPVETCQLHATVTGSSDIQSVDTGLNKTGYLVARFPIKANTNNLIAAKISGAPAVEPSNDETSYPFRIVSIKSGRTP